MALLLWIVVSGITAQAQRGWKVLFNGRSTDAWRGYGRDSFPSGGWAIEGGTLKTVPGAPAAERADLITKDKYQNFILELEWRVSPGGNSGVMYLVAEGPEYAWYTGPEMQVLDDSRHPDGKNPKTSAGALYALIAPTNKVLRPVGEFNRARLVVRNNRVQHWLNGRKVVEYVLGSDELKRLIAESKFKEMPRFMQEKGGHIVLQHHGEEVWFRNIRIRPLSSRRAK